MFASLSAWTSQLVPSPPIKDPSEIVEKNPSSLPTNDTVVFKEPETELSGLGTGLEPKVLLASLTSHLPKKGLGGGMQWLRGLSNALPGSSPRSTKKTGKVVHPWDVLEDPEAREELKKNILDLSQDPRNLTVDPPSDSAFTFSMATFSSTAILLLKLDPRLSQIRFEMVPKVLKEDVFFRNYAYRVHLLQQQALLEHPPSTEYTASLSPVAPRKESTKEDSERTEVSYDDALEEEEDWEAALEAEIARSDTEVLYEAKEDDEEVQVENSVNEKNDTKESD